METRAGNLETLEGIKVTGSHVDPPLPSGLQAQVAIAEPWHRIALTRGLQADTIAR